MGVKMAEEMGIPISNVVYVADPASNMVDEPVQTNCICPSLNEKEDGCSFSCAPTRIPTLYPTDAPTKFPTSRPAVDFEAGVQELDSNTECSCTVKCPWIDWIATANEKPCGSGVTATPRTDPAHAGNGWYTHAANTNKCHPPNPDPPAKYRNSIYFLYLSDGEMIVS